MDIQAWFVAAVGCAGLAAAATWLFGLPLRRAADDPTIAERFHRHRFRLMLVVIVSAIVPLLWFEYAGGLGTGPWLVPGAFGFVFVAGMGAIVGGYPLRRALSGEGNPLPVYVLAGLRGVLAMYGFWLAVALLPYFVHAAGAGAPVVAAFACVALLLCSRHHPRFVCAMLGVERLEDPEFERILDRSDARRPGVYSFGNDRGSLVNAFALPSLRDPRILMSRPLLRDLTHAEAAGVFAHELAHHEDFKVETLRRWGWQERAFIVLGALGPLVLPAGWLLFLLWGWPVLLVLVLGRRAAGMQDRERYSDRRGVELCGDREGYIRALEKIHEANHLPRRLAHEAEQRSSHPSLARRIRALREADGVAETQSPPDGIFRSRKSPAQTLRVQEKSLRWDGGAESQEVPVSDLVELRLLPTRRGPRLRAVERSGKKHTFAVLAEDAAGLQEALDRLDGKLAELPKTSSWEPLGLLLALAVSLASLLAAASGVFSIMSALLLTVGALSMGRRRSRGALAAVAAMAVYVAAQSVLLPFDRTWWDRQAWSAIAVTGIGGATLLAIALRAQLSPGRFPRVWIAVGLLGWIPMLFTLLDGDIAFRIHVLGRTSPGLFLPWVAAGAAALSLRRRSGAFLLALGLTGMLAGTTWFWRAAAQDPFAAEAPSCSIEERPYRPLASVELPFEFRDAQLSPGAVRYLARTLGHYRVGDFNGASYEFSAVDASFVGDERVLKIMGYPAGYRLELVQWDAPDVVIWSLPLENWALGAEVDLSVHGDRWELFSDRARFVTSRLRGRIESTEVEYRSWVTDDMRGIWRFAAVGEVLLENRTTLVERRTSPLHLIWLLNEAYEVSVLRRIEGESDTAEFRSAAHLGFLAPAETDGAVLCVSHGPGGAALWTYDAKERELTPRASVDACRGWQWDGKQVALVQAKWVSLVDLAGRSIRRAPLPEDPDWGPEIALADGRVLLGWNTGMASDSTCSIFGRLDGVFTVGHSNRSLAEFTAVLQAHAIALLVDVRSYPSSRRHPQFNRPQLEKELPLIGIRYLWLGRELGGMRDDALADSPHTALDEGGFRNYADHMGTALFADGMARLLAESENARVACMCAEKDWHECHRRYLSDALVALHHTPVAHLRDKSEPAPHELHEVARVVDGRLLYDAGGQRQATLF